MSSRWFQVRRIHRIQNDVEVKNVILDDLLQSPFSARIEVREGVHESGRSLRTQAGAMGGQRYLCPPREREEQ
jgi:hypothetical protein